jgi:hypothetical protein
MGRQLKSHGGTESAGEPDRTPGASHLRERGRNVAMRLRASASAPLSQDDRGGFDYTRGMLRPLPVSFALVVCLGLASTFAADPPRTSACMPPPVDDLQHLASKERRQQAPVLLQLPGSPGLPRRAAGDEYVPPSTLTEARDFLQGLGIRCAGGIATVPGLVSVCGRTRRWVG